MTVTDTPVQEKLVGALSAGLKIVRYLARASSPVGVTRIAKDLELNSSTCFNLLKTLVHERLVNFEEATKTYTLGFGFVELAKGALEKSSYVHMMRPHLRELAARHNITTTLWQRTSEDRVVLVDLAESQSPLRIHMSIGQRLPMYIAALGRCMAAHMDLSPIELRSKLVNLRWEDGPSFETYLQEVERARVNGYAVDRGNFAKGVVTISSAILDGQRQPFMAISAVGFSTQLSENGLMAICEDLRDRSQEVTRAISGGLVRDIPSSAAP